MAHHTQGYPQYSPPSYSPQGLYPPQTSLHARHELCTVSPKVQCFLIGAALAAITAVACYYCFTRGFTMIDTGTTTLQQFGGYSLVYMGVAFSVASVGNVLYSGIKLVCTRSSGNFEYSEDAKRIQIGATLFAPVAMIPVAFVCALSVLAGGRR